MIDCHICYEALNKSTRKQVICEFCPFVFCRKCVKRYLLDTSEDAHCMNCRKRWNRGSLSVKFENKFLNVDFKKHREQVLYERELSLLPATQPHVEAILERVELNAELARTDLLIKELLQRKRRIKDTLIDVRSRPAAQKELIHACPSDSCRGFLTAQYQCGICKKNTCRTCFELREDDDHKCNPATVDTVAALKKETVPCPKCGARIFKIEGCDQMFCVQCHTPFSWKTGRVITSTIHNPHYFEWLKQGGSVPRAEGDYVCARVIDQTFISRFTRDGRYRSAGDYERLRSLIHLRDVDLPRYRVNPVRDNLDLRVEYLMKKIDENTFKTKAQREEKKRDKKQDMGHVLSMFIDAVTDIFYDTLETNISTRYTEFEALVDYVNLCFKNIAALYNCRAPQLSRGFQMIYG